MGEDAAIDFISTSVFYISIGINDYIHYYLLNVSNVQNLYLPWGFNQFLASTMSLEIKVMTFMLKFKFFYSAMVEKKKVICHLQFLVAGISDPVNVGNTELVQHECSEICDHGATAHWLCSLLLVDVQK